ncbi:hypothetical protein Rxycam_00278 [Rubrobacter xylanophilus DSM 9941]|uniref:hypothetical protein n=1 Tax=Rubrobacter xylanophilus TaxID=49319 RepID=UPI001C63D44E|nr:hypothetical protein [Rubrobacter xylanophilus]QYJ14482.1 hypothetical protein Rxycam_00278 [Rubrobacter xylanophilus DSM 9941]
MIGDLVLALLAAAYAGVVPGWFWARLLGGEGRIGLVAHSVAFSISLVPALALLPTYAGFPVTLPVALLSPAAVFLGGLLLHRRFGGPKTPEPPLAPPPPRPSSRALLLLVLAFVPAAGAAAGLLPLGAAALASLALAGAAAAAGGDPAGPELPRRWVEGLLAAVVLLVLLRGYLGPVLHDWPHIRGIDKYTQAIMVDLMLSRGSVESYMVYPPGFHALMAAVCRLGGLDPLELFPVLAPAFLLLPALALYVLGRTLWGEGCGVAAALLGGLVLGSPYLYLVEARYPQLISAQFLTVLALAALFRLLAAPSPRAGISLAVLGSSVVLYHHVGAYFFALVLAAAAFLLFPFLLLRGERRRAGALFVSLGGLGVLSILYAWDTYDLAGLLLGNGDSGATAEAVSGAIGTQQPFPLSHLVEPVSHPVLWLGLLGVPFALLGARRSSLPGRLAPGVLLVWCLIMFAGSRTALSGFPERFERDLGVPLVLFAAYALVMLLRPALRLQGESRLAVAVAALAGLVVVAGAVRGLAVAALPAPEGPSDSARLATTPTVEAAGRWLEDHNAGGNIIVTPYIDHVPSRALLAMGGYSAVQTFNLSRIERARDLPPSGRKPPLDAFVVMKRPGSPEARRVLRRYDVRYVVLSKDYPGVDWREFERLPGLYRKTFENDDVVIYAPV